MRPSIDRIKAVSIAGGVARGQDGCEFHHARARGARTGYLESERRTKVDSILRRARELEPEERRDYIRQASGGDDEIVRAVEELLTDVSSPNQADASLPGASPRPSAGDAHGPFEPMPEGRSTTPPLTQRRTIGPYHLLEMIGEGGMGDVWLASQRTPVRRYVAIKIIKLGMDTREVLARFETERQALAVMDHPNIAKILDGGATESGRPYFVMEHVKGVPITEYCDTYRLGLRDRIKLVLAMCHGVQHAHLKGVIHRDIKPSNLLVTVKEDKPELKIIDFGLAKAVGTPFSSTTIHTGHGEMLGTPAYMSPEQANAGGVDIDTRTDVYSLGVVLYELLAGKRPYTSAEVRGWALLHTLHDRPIPRPSSRYWENEGRSEIARRRSTSEVELRRRLRRDLDWIVLKATQLDRTRRYETPAALAADLERYLDDEPVLARPPSARYRTVKFVRRNAVLVGAAVAVFVTLSAGLVVSLSALRTADEARARAQEEASASEMLAEALSRALSPRVDRASSTSALGPEWHLQSAASALANVDDEVKPRLIRVLARAYLENGLVERALELYQDNLTLLSTTDASPLERQWAHAELLVARSSRGQPHDIDQAIRGLRDRLLPQLQEHATDAPEAVALVHMDLGDLYDVVDSLPQAEVQYKAAAALLREAEAPTSRLLYEPLWLMGSVNQRQGRYEAAEASWREALAVLEGLEGTDAERARVLDTMSEMHLERALGLRRSRGAAHCRECDSVLQQAVLVKQQAIDRILSSDLLDERARMSGAFGVRLDFLLQVGDVGPLPGLDASAARKFLRQAIEMAESHSQGRELLAETRYWYNTLEASLRRDGLAAEADEVAGRRAAYLSGLGEAEP